MISVTKDPAIPELRERKDFPLFQEMTRRLNEKDALIVAQSAEIISRNVEAGRNDARIVTLIDSCPLGVIFVCDRVIEYVNKKILDITGYTREDLVGKNSRILYDTAGEWDVVGAFQGGVESRNAKIKTQFKKKNGCVFEVELQMTRVVDECDQEFVVLVYTEK